ncbi:MAG: response regulator transcription factor, partial [Bacteroidetes bacterium]|nr:response regulator transcription factor [Bacteroidota bacterium]
LTDTLLNLNIPVIFITAHREYAIKAFRIAAIDYLLKPVDPDELIQAVEKATEQYEKKSWMQKFSVFLESASKPAEPPKRIVLRTLEAIHVIPVIEIIYLEADRNYTTFYIKDRASILVSGSIGEYESLISSQYFMRIHQSFLLNLEYLRSFEKSSGMILTVTGEKLPVASRKKDSLMQYLNSL